MSTNSDFKLVKEKKLDGNAVLRITKNSMNGRIFVEFSSKSPKVLVQKNFQDTIVGRQEAEDFTKSISSNTELVNYIMKRKQ